MIDCIFKNTHGAWVIYGQLGQRVYYYYTKEQAKKMYLQECKEKLFFNE